MSNLLAEQADCREICYEQANRLDEQGKVRFHILHPWNLCTFAPNHGMIIHGFSTPARQ